MTESEAVGGVTQRSLSYTYDKRGNRLTLTVTGSEEYTVAYTCDANNRLITEVKTQGGITTTTTYGYDANGNQTTKTTDGVTQTSMYNLFGQLTGDGILTYTYRPDGLRSTKSDGTTTTVHIWDSGNIVAEMQNNAITVTYIRGINLIASDVDGVRTYYLYNAHGDVVNLTDSSATVTKSYDYDAFGVERNIAPGDANPFRYCAEYYDKETGELYLRARYYDPVTGRFSQEDPIGSGLNWYTYCSNDPILFIDPTGYWEETDSKFSSTVQSYLLKLTYFWYMADSDEARNDIHEEAERVRDIYSSGLGWLLDNAKIISGALADEYFLGDCSVDERDYWLYLAQEFQPDIKIDNRPILRGAIFIAGFVTPSIDDVWRYVSKKASKEMIETIGEKESKKFLKSMTKFAGKAGRNGIKKLEGKGIKGFMYEVKVISKSGAYRLLGNKAKTGEIIWEVFEKTHH